MFTELFVNNQVLTKCILIKLKNVFADFSWNELNKKIKICTLKYDHETKTNIQESGI